MSWASLGQALRAGPAGSLVFEPEGRDLEGVPFAQILRVGEARDELRRALIEARIYSAVLWPLDERPGRSAESLSFSRESLALHCDPRWDEQDLLRVAGAVHKAWEAIS